MGERRVLTNEEIQRLEAKVAEVESRSSARLEVVIARREWLGLRRLSRRILKKHGRRGIEGHPFVLILLVTHHRRFLVAGDTAAHEALGEDFWHAVRDRMAEELRAGGLYEGLSTGVQILDEALTRAFPARDEARPEPVMRVLFA